MEHMERHTYFCPMGGLRNEIHKGLAHQIAAILKEAGVPSRNIEMELRGLQPGTNKRPGDVIALHFFGDGQHLLIDVAFTTVWSNTNVPHYIVASLVQLRWSESWTRSTLTDKRSAVNPVSR